MVRKRDDVGRDRERERSEPTKERSEGEIGPDGQPSEGGSEEKSPGRGESRKERDLADDEWDLECLYLAEKVGVGPTESHPREKEEGPEDEERGDRDEGQRREVLGDLTHGGCQKVVGLVNGDARASS